MTERAGGLAGWRVLVVEDEAIIGMLIESMLTGFGCAVVGVAASVTRAFEQMDDAGGAIDAALLDVNLSGHTSAPVARRLQAAGVPFAFCTGYGAQGAPAEFPAAPVLGKPFGIESLRETLLELRQRGAPPLA